MGQLERVLNEITNKHCFWTKYILMLRNQILNLILNKIHELWTQFTLDLTWLQEKLSFNHKLHKYTYTFIITRGVMVNVFVFFGKLMNQMNLVVFYQVGN